MTLRILVVGAGSIGRRHARNLLALGADVDLADVARERAGSVEGARPVDVELARSVDYDGVVLATPNSLHATQLAAALAAGAPKVMVEKPMAVSAAEAEGLVAAGRDRVMVAHNLRFHQPVVDTVDLVANGAAGRVHALRVWTGSYLPDWRPGADYRETYSARAALGGGILLDAIHELDIVLWLLDDRLEIVGAVAERLSDLELDVEDTVRALLRHTDGPIVEIALDYTSRVPRRGIEVIGDAGTVRLDWARAVIEVETPEGREVREASVPVDRSYELEAAHFLDWIGGRAEPPVDVERGFAAVALADAIRQAAAR